MVKFVEMVNYVSRETMEDWFKCLISTVVLSYGQFVRTSSEFRSSITFTFLDEI